MAIKKCMKAIKHCLSRLGQRIRVVETIKKGAFMSISNEKRRMHIKDLNDNFALQAKNLDLTNDGQTYKSLRTARAWTKFLARFYQ